MSGTSDEQPPPEQPASEEAAGKYRPLSPVAPKAVSRRQAEQEGAVRSAIDEALKKQAAKEKAKQRAAEEREAEQQAASLSISRQLVRSSNTAAAMLEADAAYNKLATGGLSVYEQPFFQEEEQFDREQYLAKMMTRAARGLLDAFTDLLNAHEVWDSLAHSELTLRQALRETPSPYRFRMELAELLTQHIPEVLLTLGYHPPPPSEEWADLVQNSVQRLLSATDGNMALARNSAKAHQELAFFTWRLRELVEAAEQSLEEEGKKDKSRFAALRHFLRPAVSGARNRAVPAALASGIRAAAVGVPGGPPGMTAAFLTGSVGSLLETATEAGATALLAERGHEDAPLISASRAVRADIAALGDCIELMRSATSTTIDNVRFIIRRGVFRTLEDSGDCPIPMRDFLWNWSKDLLSLLEAEEFSVDVALKVLARAKAEFAEP